MMISANLQIFLEPLFWQLFPNADPEHIDADASEGTVPPVREKQPLLHGYGGQVGGRSLGSWLLSGPSAGGGLGYVYRWYRLGVTHVLVEPYQFVSHVW